MSEEDIIKMWKDESYRASQSEDAPENPAGELELSDDDLDGASGGAEHPTITISIGATMFLSCAPSCDNTLIDGTCNVFSIGCCKTE